MTNEGMTKSETPLFSRGARKINAEARRERFFLMTGFLINIFIFSAISLRLRVLRESFLFFASSCVFCGYFISLRRVGLVELGPPYIRVSSVFNPWLSPTRGLFSTIIDGSSNFRLQITALHDAVNISMLEQELARLKPFRKFHSHRRLNCSWTGKSNQRFGLRKDQVTQ